MTSQLDGNPTYDNQHHQGEKICEMIVRSGRRFAGVIKPEGGRRQVDKTAYTGKHHLPVKLPNKAHEFARVLADHPTLVIEILRQKYLLKRFLVPDEKRIASLNPLEDPWLLMPLRFLFDDIHKMLGKGGGGGVMILSFLVVSIRLLGGVSYE